MSDTATPAPLWDDNLLARYDIAGPRYTSYPTALQFSANFGAAEYRALWPQPPQADTPLSLYVHIPFCSNICYYCACNKIVTRRPQLARRYLDYLKKDIAMQAALTGATRPVTQLHWGGGTPTFLSGAELTELMHAIASRFKLIDSPAREYAIEIDPRDADSGQLALLKGLGFNRLSFGVQDFDERVQRAINRVQPRAHVAQLCDTARSYGFTSLGFDLIYGLPLQTTASLQRTLEQVIALAPNRIAFYNYAHLPRQFPAQRAIDRLQLPDASAKIALLRLANRLLGDAGYLHIGMDHFVRPGDELARAQRDGRLQRNFQGYSIGPAQDLVGIGVSAISSSARGYAQNSKQLDEYYRRLDDNVVPVERGLLVSRDDAIRRAAIMQLICQLQLDFAALDREFGIDSRDYFRDELSRLLSFAEDGLLTLDDSGISITATGRLLLRNICMVFDRYLACAPVTLFSRAV